MRTKALMAALALIGATAAVNTAQAAEWTQLGERIIDFRNSAQTVVMKDQPQLTGLKLQAKKSAIEILTVTVFLTNGETIDTELNAYLAPGKETRVIELAGAKTIDKVTFSYRNPKSSNDVLSIVRIYGES